MRAEAACRGHPALLCAVKVPSSPAITLLPDLSLLPAPRRHRTLKLPYVRPGAGTSRSLDTPALPLDTASPSSALALKSALPALLPALFSAFSPVSRTHGPLPLSYCSAAPNVLPARKSIRHTARSKLAYYCFQASWPTAAVAWVST